MSFNKRWDSALLKKTYSNAEVVNFPHNVNDPNASHYLKSETYSQAEVISLLATKENIIPTGTSSQYYNGLKQWAELTTTVVTEGTNLYFTNPRARAALSKDDPVTYNSATGVIGLSFNSSNLRLTTGQLNTIQDITASSTPQFSQVNLGLQASLTTHSVRADRTITANAPITGGGNFTADRSIGLSINATNLRITSNALNTIQDISTSSSPQFANLTLSGVITQNGTSENTFNGNIRHIGPRAIYNNFLSGWAGTGFRLDYNLSTPNQASLELDNLWVRGTMNVYELIINQIRATNGSLFVTSSGKVKTITQEGSEQITFEDPSGHNAAPFLEGDIIMCQRVTLNQQTVIKRIIKQVTQVNGTTVTVINLAGYTNVGSISQGDEFVRIGSVSNSGRQGTVYLTSDDSESPFIDIYDQVSSFATWTAPAKLRARIGKLSGVFTSGFGPLTGYGLYSKRSLLEEDCQVRGTISAGDSGGYDFNFYAGRIRKNLFYKSENGQWGETGYPLSVWTTGTFQSSLVMHPGPGGQNVPVNFLSGSTGTTFAIITANNGIRVNTGDQRNKTYTISFWIKASSPQVAGNTTLTWEFPEGTSLNQKVVTVTTSWQRVVYTFTNSGQGSASSNTKISFPVINDQETFQGFHIYGIQMEESSVCSLYQRTDGAHALSDGYGMWTSRGGFGGTIQNPRVSIATEGIIVRSSPSSSVSWGGTNTISIGYSGSSWGIIGNSGGNNIFRLGSTNSIAGWEFDSDRLFIGNNYSGFALNTGQGAFLDEADGVGFEIYDAQNPKLFIGDKRGNFLDWNITASGKLTLNGDIKGGEITGTVFKTGTGTNSVVIGDDQGLGLNAVYLRNTANPSGYFGIVGLYNQPEDDTGSYPSTLTYNASMNIYALKKSANYASSRLTVNFMYDGLTFIQFRSRLSGSTTDQAGIYIKRDSSSAIDKVLGARRTGWAAPTGTATRTTFATSTVTVQQLAERLKALIDDLTVHGLIGS